MYKFSQDNLHNNSSGFPLCSIIADKKWEMDNADARLKNKAAGLWTEKVTLMAGEQKTQCGMLGYSNRGQTSSRQIEKLHEP